jgi:myo-inositol-1(or 4)-monophosphatase
VSDEGAGPTAESVGDGSAAELCEIAVRAARAAGELLGERFALGEQRQVSSKSTPTDLVSEADLAAERTIRELLARLRPEDGFLGEESGGGEGVSGLRWVVDPLDGTVNFLFGIPQWCVSVAVQDAHGSLAGAIYDPCREELFAAVRGSAPTLSDRRGSRTFVSPLRGELATAMVATGLAYDARVRAAQARVLARVIPQVRDIRRFGSAALDLAWTALGRFDAYFERTVKPWDIAAGTLICAGAGLEVVELPERVELLECVELPGRVGLAEGVELPERVGLEGVELEGVELAEDVGLPERVRLPWGILVAPPALADALGPLVDAGGGI